MPTPFPRRAVGSQAVESPYRDYNRNPSFPALAAGRRHNASTNFRSASAELDSDEDDAEVLPSASSAGSYTEGGLDSGAVWRDGQWFNVLDEQYLLPVFSNATASRRQASRKAFRLNRSDRHVAVNEDDNTGPELDLGVRRE